MNIVFTPTAWDQYTEWQKEEKKMVKRINELIKDIDRNGLLKGIGRPEPLKHRKACSRRTTGPYMWMRMYPRRIFVDMRKPKGRESRIRMW